ncbi:MAG: murein biosynthesis integral membrane protein MurJ [Acidobacteria bacterium]|nr:murein biosynthesis integral membrane protein MurJ [Acidobacteriota bacterium]
MSGSKSGRPEGAGSLLRSAGVVSAAVLLSRLTGLAREIAMARLFGAGIAKDAFDVGFRIPNLMRDLFAEGALSSAFVPTVTHYLTGKSRLEAARLSNLVATALILVVGALCALGMLFSPALVDLLAGKFGEVPGKRELAVSLTRIMFPFLLLVALAAQAMGVLNADRQFGVPALASSFFNAGSLVFGLGLGYWLAPRLGLEPIHGMAFGVVVGGAMQLFVQAPSLRRSGFAFRPALDWSHPGLRQVFTLMGPAILGTAAVQVNVMVNTNFAAGITDPAGRVINGPVSWLGYAFRFMQLPLGLFGVAIAQATLPAISRSAAQADLAGFRDTLSRSLGMVFLLTVPSSVGLAVLGEAMIGVVYEGGRFLIHDTRQTALALTCYAVGLAGYSAVKILAPAFYALNDSRTPMVVSLASIAVNYFAASALVAIPGLRHAGLALSTSTVALFSAAALFWTLRNRIGGIHDAALARSVGKILLASAVMGAACLASSHAVRGWLGVSRWARAADLALSLPLGLTVFYGVARWARVAELEAGARALAGPLGRRWQALRAKLQ